jgi:hypothetical protein
MFICETPAKVFIQGTKAHNGYDGCPRCIEEREFIDDRMTFPAVDCASQPIVLPDLPIMSDELFIAFDEDCLNVNFLKKMVNMSCEYVSILNPD